MLTNKLSTVNNGRAGFTLIEILVVTAIMGLLASVVLSTFSIVRKKARDSVRVQDLNTIAKALEIYYIDKGSYPAPVGEYWGTSYSDATYGWQNLQTALTPYLPKVPRDPLRNNDVPWAGPTSFSYVYGWVGKDASGKDYYTLVATLEDPGNPLRCELKSYRWHWHNSGVLLCNNGGPGGWHYNIMGYQASHAIW